MCLSGNLWRNKRKFQIVLCMRFVLKIICEVLYFFSLRCKKFFRSLIRYEVASCEMKWS